LPHRVCFGETRKVNWRSMVSVGGALYSVPHELIDQRVWARSDGSELIVVHARSQGSRAAPADRAGTPRDQRRALSAKPGGALERKPRASTAEEHAFLQIGPAAEAWLIKAGVAGAQRVWRKMAEAVDLAKFHGSVEVERD
jgi:hypothetical protein